MRNRTSQPRFSLGTIALPLSIWMVSLVVPSFFGATFEHLKLSSDPDLLLRAPWTILTYAWIHESPLHLILNLGVLFMLAIIWNDRSLGRFYLLFILGILAGGVAFVLFSQDYRYAYLCGASAGISSLLAGYLLETLLCSGKHPGMVTYLLLFLVAIDLSSLFVFRDSVWYIHPVGYVLGAVVYLISYYHKRSFKENKRRDRDTFEDQILRKAKDSGYQSLTEEEKSTLRQLCSSPYIHH